MSEKKKKNRPGRPEGSLPRNLDGSLTKIGKIASKIRKARSGLGFTATECADKSGLSVSRWYDYESAKIQTLPPIDRLIKIEDVLCLRKKSLVRLAYPSL